MRPLTILALFTLTICIIVSCSKNSDNNPISPPPPPPPVTAPVTAGSIKQDAVEKNKKKYYLSTVTVSKKYSLNIFDLSDSALSLAVSGDEKFDSFLVVSSDRSEPKEIQLTASNASLYFMTDGQNISSAQSDFSILLLPIREDSNYVNEGERGTPGNNLAVSIPVNEPTEGQVGTRGTSYYIVKGLDPANHT